MAFEQTLIQVDDMNEARTTARDLGDAAIVEVDTELWVVNSHGGRQLVRNCRQRGLRWKELELFGRSDTRCAGAKA